MALRPGSALALVSAIALVAAGPVRAGVSGNVEVEGQTTQNVSGGAAGTRASLLTERLSLHWAGLPFGPAVAFATAGGALSNVEGWMSNGVRTGGRILSFDGSVGLLPRRAVPLRLYGSGSVDAGGGGALASHGAGPTFLYGGALNLEPGLLPGLRLDVSEGRSSRPGHEDLSDVQRRLAGSSYGTVAGQRVNLSVRLDDDRRDAAGHVVSAGATLNVSSAPQQTTLVASQVRRSIPSLSGIGSDRAVSGDGTQRWSPTLTTQLGARFSEASGAGATGTLADGRAGFTWVALPGERQLTLSGGGSAGRTRTSGAAGAGEGTSLGGSARAGWSQPLGSLRGGIGVGAAADTCDCTFGNEGTASLLDASLSLGVPALARGSAEATWAVALARAPMRRGGDRREHHGRTSGRLVLGAGSALVATLSYDEGVRELVDITAGRAATVRERAVGGSLGVSTNVGTLSLSGDLRHTRGSVVTDASPFVARGVRQARTMTSGQAGLGWRPLHDVTLQAQAIGTWTTLEDGTSAGSFGVNAGLSWRLGRLTWSLQYQALRVELVGTESSLQQSVRTVLSRPFEI